jgi:glyoxylase-like metal-dependent hydrolase (beta-lactamase superfamily II)
MQLGDFRVDHVIDGSSRMDPVRLFKGSTAEQWAEHRYLLDEEGLLPFSMGAFLVRGRGRVVLIDAGLGPGRLIGVECGELLDNLRSVGVLPDEVTDVILTHLHLDHVGWVSQAGSVVFSNAVHRCSRADWNYFMTGDQDTTVERLQPAIDQFELWDSDGTILSGLDTLSTPGHTPGSTTVVLSAGKERAMILGDVAHCPVELVDDEWAVLGDVDPQLARRTRNALARELEGTDVRVAGPHFPGMQFGRLLIGEGKRRFVT